MMQKEDFGVLGGILLMGITVLLIVFPYETIAIVAPVGIVGAGGYAAVRWFRALAPAYATATALVQYNQVVQKPMIASGQTQFRSQMHTQINQLRTDATTKQKLFEFVVNADTVLKNLMQNEKVATALVGVQFGALTVTFKLRLREYNRANLEKLMKMDALIAQALHAETVRLVQESGYISCEVASPARIAVSLNLLQHATSGTTVAIGMDTVLRPVVVDISQHGLIAAIAPSRRGKTQAIRTMLYLLKRANPEINLVIVAFKSADWQVFNHCASIILDSDELKQFQSWLLQTMYAKAKQPDRERWVVVFDDLVNLLSLNSELTDTVKQCASLGAGVGVTTIVSTQFTGKDSGGVAMTANATARLMFKPSSNLQGARDGGMAGLGLDQLSTAKGDALLIVDGETTRMTTAMTDDSLITQLPFNAPARTWMQNSQSVPKQNTTMPTSISIQPMMEELIEKLDDWLLDGDSFDWKNGKFFNRAEALRRLEWSNNGRTVAQLQELEKYIYTTYLLHYTNDCLSRFNVARQKPRH